MATTQIFIVVLLTLAVTVTYTAAGLIDVCQWETFEARCQEDEVILIKEANYGRMRVGRCQPRNYFVDCSADVTAIMHARCSGRQHCSVPIPDSAMFASTPCPKDLVSYLEADYKCVKVSKSSTDNCEDQILTGLSGYISNPKMNTKRYVCPHRIVAQPGQTVNVYLSDFYSNENMVVSDCVNYGIVSEGNIMPTKICGGEVKTNRLIYSSKTNVVDISLVSNHTHNYLLRYQVIGCPTLQAPANSWVKVQDRLAIITCNFSSTAYNLVCSENQWTGDLKNCTGPNIPTTGSMSGNSFKGIFADTGLTVVCVGLALGVLCAVGLFTLALTYLGSRRNKNEQPAHLPQTPGLCERPIDFTSDHPSSEKSYKPVDQYQPVYVPITMDSCGQYTTVNQNNSVPSTIHASCVTIPTNYSTPLNTCVTAFENNYGIVSSMAVRDCGHNIYDLAALSHTLGRKKIVEIDNGCPV